MLSFATEFPVRASTAADFISVVRTWLVGSPHTKLTAEHLADVPEEGQWKVEVQSEQVEALIVPSSSGETAAFKYVAADKGLEWTTTVVFSRNEDDCWIGLRTSRESVEPQIRLPKALKPHIIKTILAHLKGGLDDETYVNDEPFFLKSTDINMASRLLNGDAENYLPVVFVSCDFSGNNLVDPHRLARVLGGMAHVFVEPDREFSRALQSRVGSRNVYGGRVGIYWPNGERFIYYINEYTPTEALVRKAVADDIRLALINRRPLQRTSWSQAEALIARSALSKLKESGSENIDEYISAFDSEIAAKNRQLLEAEAEVEQLRSRLRTVDSSGENQRGIRIDTGSEQSYFDGEVTEILRDAIARASENEQQGGRRQHVLQNIVSLMPLATGLKDRRGKLKNALSQYRSMTRDAKRQLEELGFSLSEEGKHIKLVYMRDERYTFVLPKSGSDGRGGMNSVSDIAKRVF